MLFDFVFRFSYGVAKLQSFVGPFFSLHALFLAKLSWQALPILIHAQTTLTCVSLPWLRYYHRVQRLA